MGLVKDPINDLLGRPNQICAADCYNPTFEPYLRTLYNLDWTRNQTRWITEGELGPINRRGEISLPDHPLHFALSNGLPISNLVSLLDPALPRMAAERDQHGHLPLHYALSRPESSKVLQLCPEAILLRSVEGESLLHRPRPLDPDL